MSTAGQVWRRSDRYHFAAIIGVAILVRGVIAVERNWVGYDEANYLMIARNSVEGIGYVQSPLTAYAPKFHCLPFLVARLLGPVLGDYLLASKVLFATLGPVAVGLAILLGTRLFGKAVGLTTGALCAVAPVWTTLLSSSLTHTLFLPLHLGGLWLAWVAVERSRPLLAVAAGAAMGLGWWARPDGMLVVPTTVVFLVVGGLLLSDPKRTALTVGGFLGVFGLLYAAYGVCVASISAGDSAPHGPLFDFLQYAPDCDASADLTTYGSLFQLAINEPQCVLQAIVKNAREAPAVLFTWTGFPVVLLPLVGAGWVAEQRYDRRTVAAHALLLTGVAPLLFYLPFYFRETRYVAPYAVLGFVWCALGIEAIRVRLTAASGRAVAWTPLVLVAGLLLGITVLHMPRMRAMAGPEYEQAGRWLSRHAEADAVVWTSQSQVAFYADRPWRYPPRPGAIDEWESYRDARVYLVVDQRYFFEKNEGWGRIVERAEDSGGLLRLHEIGDRSMHAVIYRVGPPLLDSSGVGRPTDYPESPD